MHHTKAWTLGGAARWQQADEPSSGAGHIRHLTVKSCSDHQKPAQAEARPTMLAR